jgi:hypothetical protein
MVVREADDNEDDGEQDKPTQLDGLAANGVNGSNGDPIAWDGASTDDDQVANRIAAEDFVDIATLGEANSAENDRVVETQAIEGDL